ncbi:hypothetical protein IPG36_00405 [bacterium]|nr:MAG: hypothetical protein IPG36_00405 [bacterium]
MNVFNRSRIVYGLFLTLLSVGIPLMSAAPVQAAHFSGCHKVSCLEVFTGAKNTQNRTQLVQQVSVYSMGGSGFLEIWGDGFYKSKNGSSGTWDINMWARSGTNVCGAVTLPGVPRRIACMTIKV